MMKPKQSINSEYTHFTMQIDLSAKRARRGGGGGHDLLYKNNSRKYLEQIAFISKVPWNKVFLTSLTTSFYYRDQLLFYLRVWLYFSITDEIATVNRDGNAKKLILPNITNFQRFWVLQFLNKPKIDNEAMRVTKYKVFGQWLHILWILKIITFKL